MSVNKHLIVIGILLAILFLKPLFGATELLPIICIVPMGFLYVVVLLLCRKKFSISTLQYGFIFLSLLSFAIFAAAFIFYTQVITACNTFNLGAHFFDSLHYKVVIAHCDDTQSQPYTNY